MVGPFRFLASFLLFVPLRPARSASTSGRGYHLAVSFLSLFFPFAAIVAAQWHHAPRFPTPQLRRASLFHASPPSNSVSPPAFFSFVRPLKVMPQRKRKQQQKRRSEGGWTRYNRLYTSSHIHPATSLSSLSPLLLLSFVYFAAVPYPSLSLCLWEFARSCLCVSLCG